MFSIVSHGNSGVAANGNPAVLYQNPPNWKKAKKYPESKYEASRRVWQTKNYTYSF